MKQKVLILSVSLLTLFSGFVFAAWVEYRPYEFVCGTISQREYQKPECVAVYQPHLDADAKDEWTGILGRFSEMPMQDLPACEEESYRVVWIPAFHNPISVRIWRTGDRFYGTSRRLSGRGGYEWGTLAMEDTRALTDEEWLEATRLIRAAGIWGRPVAEPDELPNDGALWVIEGRADGQSRVFFRRGADLTLREACRYLVNLSGWKTEIERY